MRIDRMLSITVMLLNRDRISARELAGKFEVSIRTIYRDIETINMAGIPVISYPGNNGGFGIVENYRIDRQLLTLNDILGILTALKGVNSALNDLELDSAIEKISSIVPRENSGDIDLRFEQMVIDMVPWGYPLKIKRLLKELQNSIYRNMQVEINYVNARSEHSLRIIEPMTLILKGHVWYLFAFCRMREGYRLFRLSRISSIKQLQETFQRREASYRDYFSMEPGTEPPIDLVLKFSPEARVRVDDYFGDTAEIQENGDIIVKISYPEDHWVYSLILSFGELAEVMEPAHIREIIRKKAKKIQSIYKPDMMLSQD